MTHISTICTHLEAAIAAAKILRDTPAATIETMDPATFEYSRKVIAGLNETIRQKDLQISQLRATVAEMRDDLEQFRSELAGYGCGLVERGA